MADYRYELSRWLLSILLFITIASYYIGYAPLEDIINTIGNWFIIIAAFALPLGAINLVGRAYKNIQKKGRKWYLDIWMLFVLAATSIIGVTLGSTNNMYLWIYNNINLPCGAMMYAITGLFVASAIYRAFRVRNMESFLLCFALVFVMLKNAPIGAAIWSGFPIIGTWISTYPQSTGYAVIWIVAGIGWIGLAIRYILMREKIVGATGSASGGK